MENSPASIRYAVYNEKFLYWTVLALGTFSLSQYLTFSALNMLSDFSAFYIAGQMALEGRVPEVYDLQSYQAFYQQYFKSDKWGYGWFYPPHFLIPLSLLAELPPNWAKFVWLAGTYAIYLFGMSKVVRKPGEWVLVVFLPAAFVNLHAGQTGFLTTGLLAIYLGHSANSKVTAKATAGIALALLTFKPHLWVTLPLLVLLRRQSITLIACLVSLVVLVMTSIMLFGYETWLAMFSSVISSYGQIHDGQTLLFNKMSTIAVLASQFGFSEFKLIVQLLFLMLSVCAIFWAAYKKASGDLITGFAIVSGLIAAPHNMIYDHTILIIPCLLAMRPENELPKWSIVVLAGIYFFPYIALLSDALEFFPFGAVVLLVFWSCLFALMIRSTFQSIKQANQSSSNFQLVHPKVAPSHSTPEMQGQ